MTATPLNATAAVAALKARPGSPVGPGLATGFDATSSGLKPRFTPGDLEAEPSPARVTLPARANAALHLEDTATGTAVDVTLRGAIGVAGQVADGYVVYAAAVASGASLLQRAIASGTEDFFAFDAKPAATQIAYDIALGSRAAGLRMVGGSLEMLDASGAPRLRVAPPYVVGADGVRTDAMLAVSGCAVDTDPAPPWGRAVTAPGAATCLVSLTWPESGVTYPAILDPRWTTTGSMGTARQDHTTTLLANGKVLVTGGRSTTGTAGLATAELYDRTTGTWSPTGSMAAGRFLHRATQLATGANPTTSGKVLVSGGIDGTISLSTFQLYDPATGTWSSSGNLNAPRHGHTATLLADGKVLAAGGLNGTTTLATAAIYNPSSGLGSWAATTGPLPPTGQRNHTAVLLQTANQQLNNKVLLVGGNSGTATLAAVYLFDPAQSAFSTLQPMPAARELHTMTLLANGKVLVTGGKNGATSLNTTAIFDPGSGPGSWSTAGIMTSARWGHSATILPASIVADGQVLVAGGNNGSGALASAELFSGTSTWTATPAMPSPPSQGHTATLLGNNMILIAGGLNGSTVLTNARLYDASFGLGCSSPSQCPSGSCVNGVCCDTSCNGGCGACNLAGHLGTCTALSSGSVCRAASAGGCDVSETCNGSSLNCPADSFAPTSTVCRVAADVCDQAENCSGNSPTCPSDAKKASGTTCPDDGNACTTDLCNGTSAACQHAAGNAGTQCRVAAGVCDLPATCTGSSASCPANAFKPSSSVCRAANGTCDTAENCTGTSAACPTDMFLPLTTVCRASAGVCDVAENCTGWSAACPADAFEPPSTVCRTLANQCDIPENCSGTAANCPSDAFLANGTTCSDANACTQTDTCQSGTCSPGNTLSCTAQDQCHAAGVCDQSTGACSNPQVADGTTCNDGDGATEVDMCRSGSCVGAAEPATVLNFDTLGRWSFGQSTGRVVRLNPNHTEGTSSLEVEIQGEAELASVAMASLTNVDENALLDVLVSPQQGALKVDRMDLCMELPSQGLGRTCLGQVELSGSAQGTWQTIHFPMNAELLFKLRRSYSDLRLWLLIHGNGRYRLLFDRLRWVPSVTPILKGIATDSNGVTKAVFSYTVAGNSSATIPYGKANFLSDAKGVLSAPTEPPPTVFVAVAPPPFVAALVDGLLKWTVQSRTAIATTSSSQLPTETQPDGTKAAVLPDGTRVRLDTDYGPALDGAIVPSDTTYNSTDRGVDQDLYASAQAPIGPSSAGTLPGNFRVTDDGAAEYVVPLEVPKGRNGVEPQLALVYNSRSGDGILGPGWSLRGLDRITRCPRTFAVANEEGRDPAAVLYDDTDEFCYNGERLVPLAGSNPTEYRVKRDNFTRFVVTSRDSRGPLTFQAYRRDGLIDVYGLDAHSRSEPTRTTFAQGMPTNTAVRNQWGLATRADRFGNSMTVVYRQPSGLTPDAITYTANPRTGRSATKTVKFNYQTAAHRINIPRYASGVNLNNGGQLIRSIDVYAPNPHLPSVVTTYKVNYWTPSITSRSLLTRIQRCDGAGVCMAPTMFTWDEGNYRFRQETSDLGSVAFPLVVGDFDGNGKDDLVYRTPIPPGTPFGSQVDALRNTSLKVRHSNGTGFGSEQDLGIPTIVANPHTHRQNVGNTTIDWITADSNASRPPTPVDLNGDGLVDMIVPMYFLNNQTDVTRTILSPVRFDMFQAGPAGVLTPLPLGANPDLSNLDDPSFNPEAGSKGFGEMLWADLNGDGLVDLGRKLVSNTSSTIGTIGVRLNQGGALDSSYHDTGLTWGAECKTIGCPDPTHLFIADIDGDGRTEVVMSHSDHGTTFGVHAGVAGVSTMATNVPWNMDVRRTLDFNGDGLVDLLQVTTNPPSYQLWINTGTGFLPQKLYDPSVSADFAVINALSIGVITDLNGDAMDDIFVNWCGTGNSGLQPVGFISDGMGAFTQVNLPTIANNAHVLPTCDATFLDVDGDGLKDVVQNETSGQPGGFKVYFRETAHGDKLRKVKNGLGAEIGIEYSRYDGAGGDACQYPYACRGRNIEVVSGYTVENGSVKPTQAETTHYSMGYEGVRVDAMGNGLLGFDLVRRRNDLTGLAYHRTFDLVTRVGNWYPYVGIPAVETSTVHLSGSGRTVTRSRTTHYVLQRSDSNTFGPYFIAPDRVEEAEDENAVQFQRHTVQNFTYDAYGNLHTHETLGLVTNTRDYLEYTDIANDTDRWLLGKAGGVTLTSRSTSGEASTRRTTFSIDANTGTLLGKTIQPGDPKAELTITYTRTPEGLVEDVIAQPINDVSRTSTIKYDPIEGAWPATYVNNLRQPSRVVYHCGLGVIASSTDVNNNTTSFRYDGFGRPRGQTDPTGLVADGHYTRPDSSRGSIVSALDSTNRTRKLQYDVLGRGILSSQTAFDGSHFENVSRAYDAMSGQVGITSRPYGAAGGAMSSVWTLGYDELGRLTSVQPPNESVRTTVYEGLRVTDYVDGVRKRYRIDNGMGRVGFTASFDPTATASDHEIQTGYDYGPFGNLRHVYQPGGGTVTMDYDSVGRRTLIDDPDAGRRVTHYDAMGNVVREELAGQEDVIYVPDVLGRVTSIQQATATTTFQWDTAANGVGKLDYETSASSVTTSYVYQTNGLLQSTLWTVGGNSFQFDWSYDAAGRVQQITYPYTGAENGRFAVNLSYGGDGQMASTTSTSTGTVYWQKQNVNDDGQTLTEVFSDGLFGLHVADPVTGRVIRIESGVGPIVSSSDGSGPTLESQVQGLGYRYYPDGKLRRRDDGPFETVEEFFYDNLDRVTGWNTVGSGKNVTYGYDDNGNLRTRQEVRPGAGTIDEVFVYGENGAGPHALTTGPLGSYGYDASGRQTSRPGQPTLRYTEFDLPTQISNADESVVDFQYAADGSRVVKSSGGTQSITVGLYERRVADGVVTHTCYLPGGQGTSGQVPCDEGVVPTFFHPDRLGTVDTITSNGMVDRVKRDPFGRAYYPSNMSGPVSLGFIGQSEDQELGLINLNHRLYDAQIGRFISPDPIVHDPLDGQAYNRYSYALNSPMSFIDPSGLDIEPPQSITEIDQGFSEFPSFFDDTGDAGRVTEPWHVNANGLDIQLVVKAPTDSLVDPNEPALVFKALDSTSEPWLGLPPDAVPPPSPSETDASMTAPVPSVQRANPFPGNGSNTYAQDTMYTRTLDRRLGDPNYSLAERNAQARTDAVFGAVALPLGLAAGLAPEVALGLTLTAPELTVAGATATAGIGAVGARLFDVAPRVIGQLADPRLGRLANALSPGQLQTLINSPTALRFWDVATRHVNIINYMENTFLRITVAGDAFRIISVGPIRFEGLLNGIMNGRFLLIGPP